MRFTRLACAGVAGYLLGTFPTADLVARSAGGDLRRSGTGNPGAANAAKVLGTRAGFTVLAGDIGKGAAAATIGGVVAAGAGSHVAATSAVLGHCYPVWSGFRGGKGVAASVGQCLVTFPAYFPIDIAVAVGTASVPKLKQRSFTAILASSVLWTFGGYIWWRRGWSNAWGPRPTVALPLANLISSVAIMQRFLASRTTNTTRQST